VTSGYNAIACAIGINSHVKSVKGNWLVLSEYDDNNKVICVKTVKVDGKRIKADVWYKLQGKKFVEVKS
jgi:ribosomal protein L14